MRFRKLLSAAMIAGVIGGATTVHAYPDYLTQTAVNILSNEFRVSGSEIRQDARDLNASIFHLVPVYGIQRYRNISDERIWRTHRSRGSWSSTASALGLSRSQIADLQRRGYLDYGDFWNRELSQRYRVSASSVRSMDRSYDWAEVLAALEMGRRYGVSPNSVLQRYRSIRNWDRVDDYYRRYGRDRGRYDDRYRNDDRYRDRDGRDYDWKYDRRDDNWRDDDWRYRDDRDRDYRTRQIPTNSRRVGTPDHPGLHKGQLKNDNRPQVIVKKKIDDKSKVKKNNNKKK